MLIKKSALALSTALSLLAFTPAFAEDMSGVQPDCIMKNADGTETVDKAKCPDGKTMAGSNSSTEQMDNTKSDAAASGDTAPADSNSSATQMDQAESPATPASEDTNSDQAGSTPSTDQPADTTQQTTAGDVQPSNPSVIVPSDVMTGATIMSASDYIGKRVYDSAGNDIGEVNDLIISNDGKIQATILGVGGFLGIGEKDVAVTVSSVEMVKNGDDVKLVVNATKDELEKAPAFDPKTRNYAS